MFSLILSHKHNTRNSLEQVSAFWMKIQYTILIFIFTITLFLHVTCNEAIITVQKECKENINKPVSGPNMIIYESKKDVSNAFSTPSHTNIEIFKPKKIVNHWNIGNQFAEGDLLKMSPNSSCKSTPRNKYVWSRKDSNNQNNRFLSATIPSDIYSDNFRSLYVIDGYIPQRISSMVKSLSSSNPNQYKNRERISFTSLSSRGSDVLNPASYFIESSNHVIEIRNETLLFIDKFRTKIDLSLSSFKSIVRLQDKVETQSSDWKANSGNIAKRMQTLTSHTISNPNTNHAIDDSIVEAYIVLQDDITSVFEPKHEKFIRLWKEYIGGEPSNMKNQKSIQSTRCEKVAKRDMEALNEGIFPCVLRRDSTVESRLCITLTNNDKFEYNVTSVLLPFQFESSSSADYYWCSSLSSFSGTHINETNNIAISGYLLDIDPQTKKDTKSFILGMGYLTKNLEMKALWSWKRPLKEQEFDLALPSPTISPDGSILCVSLLGLTCFNSTAGEITWKNTNTLLSNSFVLGNDVLYIVEKQKKSDILIAYSTKNGDVLWKYDNQTLLSPPIYYQNFIYMAYSNSIDEVTGIVKLSPDGGKMLWNIFTSYPTMNAETLLPAISDFLVTSDSIFVYRGTFSDSKSVIKSQVVYAKHFQLSKVEPKILYFEDHHPVSKNSFQLYHNHGSTIADYNVYCSIFLPDQVSIGAPLSNEYYTSSLSVTNEYVECPIDHNFPDNFINQKLSIYLRLEHGDFSSTSNGLDIEVANPPKITSQNATGAPFGASISTQLHGKNLVNHIDLSIRCKYIDRNSKGFITTIVSGEIKNNNTIICKPFFPKFSTKDESGSMIPIPTVLRVQLSNDDGVSFFDAPSSVYIYPPFQVQTISPTVKSSSSISPIIFDGNGTFVEEFLKGNSMKCGFYLKTLLTFSADVDCKKNNVEGGTEFRCSCHVEQIQSPIIPIHIPLSFFVTLNNQNYNDTQNTITFFSSPTLKSIDPIRGPLHGKNQLSITGIGFFPSQDWKCRFSFKDKEPIYVEANFKTSKNIICSSPPLPYNQTHGEFTSIIHVSPNGFDYTTTNVAYTYAYLECGGAPVCLDRGKCNHITGLCECNAGYTGETCEEVTQEVYWWIILGLFTFITIGFLALHCTFIIYFQRQALSFKKILKERKDNDISTVL